MNETSDERMWNTTIEAPLEVATRTEGAGRDGTRNGREVECLRRVFVPSFDIRYQLVRCPVTTAMGLGRDGTADAGDAAEDRAPRKARGPAAARVTRL